MPRVKHRPPKSLPYRIALIEWRDAHSDRSGGWVAPEDIEQAEVLIRSCGFVVGLHLKPDHVTVAQDVAPDGQLNGVSHLPVGMVVAIHYIT